MPVNDDFLDYTEDSRKSNRYPFALQPTTASQQYDDRHQLIRRNRGLSPIGSALRSSFNRQTSEDYPDLFNKDSSSQLPRFTHNHYEQSMGPRYQDSSVTKIRPANERTASPIPDHVAQVVPPPSTASRNGVGSCSLSYQSSDESSTSRSDVTITPPPSHYSSSFKSMDQRLIDLTDGSGYTIIQRNGQRIYGPPPNWIGEPPSKGSEIFVGRVPRDCFEPELVPVFETVGKIYELRLMMDFSGSNRGFFFVRYTCREDAKRAVAELDNYEIRPNKRLGVLMSLDNNKLWLSGIPNNVTSADIKAEIEQLTEGVRKVILYPSQTDKSKPRKYAFVEYENHRAAALARRRLVPTKITLKGQEIEKVDWAEPENEVDEEIMSTVRVLFVRNLTEATSEEQLRKFFDQWSGGQVERVKKAKDYAFVHFTTRPAAERAKSIATGQFIDDVRIEVEWSKPVDKNIYNTRKYLTKILSSSASPHCPPRFDCPVMPLVGPMFGGDGFRGIGPRKRGAAGIIGLGAPGTPPPRNLIRKLTGAGGFAVPPNCGGCYDSPNQQQSPCDPAIMKALFELKLSQQTPPLYYPLGNQSMNGLDATITHHAMMDGYYPNQNPSTFQQPAPAFHPLMYYGPLGPAAFPFPPQRVAMTPPDTTENSKPDSEGNGCE